MYAPGTVSSALEQPDGKRVITGAYSRINGSSASAITRFNPNGTLDVAFQQNVGSATGAYRVRLLSNGKFLLGYSTGAPFTVGGITRQTMLRLNADGTGDSSFDIGTGPAYGTSLSYVDDYYPLPNGQTIAVGGWNRFNGAATSNGIVRLTAAGAVDPTFNAGTGANVYDDIESIVALPNGQFLVGGYLSTYNGTARNGIARLNADGSLDPSFNANLGYDSEVSNIVVQPNGNILVSGYLDYTSTANFTTGIAQLLLNGGYDNSFMPPSTLKNSKISSYSSDAMQLQPDGKIVLLSSAELNGPGTPRVARLNTNGTLDASFQPGTGPNSQPNFVALLGNGNVLVGGWFTTFSGVLDRTLVELSSTGAPVAAAPPLIQGAGTITALALQDNGQLVAGGNFSEINGQSVRRLTRFTATGSVDASFPTNVGLDASVSDLALQPDGRILVAAGTLRRYLANGTADNTFAPTSTPTQVLLQPDGRILIGAPYNLRAAGSYVGAGVARLLADGTRDNSFAATLPSGNSFSQVQRMALQANGKLLVASRNYNSNINNDLLTISRLESTGAVDASFVGGIIGGVVVNSIAVQPDGKLLVGGQFQTYAGTIRTNVARLNVDGTLDAGFAPPAIVGSVNRLLLQPNNRVLVGGFFTGAGLPTNLARLLTTGSADVSFGPTATPNSSVKALLVQPDGALVLGGSFTTVGGKPSRALARITGANVLAVAAPQAVADRTDAWPVPAHTTLQVVPDASAHPLFVDLLDVLGRPVVHQSVSSGATVGLQVGQLRAGPYLLRVTYAEGLVVRRIQVE